MTYYELVKIFCDIFDTDEDHVEKVLQKTLDDHNINCTPQQYYEACAKGQNIEH